MYELAETVRVRLEGEMVVARGRGRGNGVTNHLSKTMSSKDLLSNLVPVVGNSVLST